MRYSAGGPVVTTPVLLAVTRWECRRLLASRVPWLATVGAVADFVMALVTALGLQQRCVVSHLAASDDRWTLRIVSRTKPIENAEAVDPTLEEAYLTAMKARSV